jgi:hypothetical protein
MESLGTINLIQEIIKKKYIPKQVEIMKKQSDSKLSNLKEDNKNYFDKVVFK